MDVGATDGPIGEVEDIYFDDHTWNVRYYVVDTGKWLPGRKVLIPPHAVRPANQFDSGLPVTLTREQVSNSPDVDTARPISRQAEFVLYRYYGWIPYWLPLDIAPIAAFGDAADREREAAAGHFGGEPHLRSLNEVMGYHVTATDGEIGHVSDFLVDDEAARIRYAVVDTRNWIPGKHVLIAPEWILEVKWSESMVFVAATQEAIRNSPEYQPADSLDPEYEARLFGHYGHPVP